MFDRRKELIYRWFQYNIHLQSKWETLGVNGIGWFCKSFFFTLVSFMIVSIFLINSLNVGAFFFKAQR